MENKEIIKKDAERFVSGIQKLNSAIEAADLELRAEKYDANDIVYSRLELALNRFETWLPFFQKQIDLCAQAGFDNLFFREYTQDNTHYYTLNAKNLNQSYRIRLIEHELTKNYGHDRFKLTTYTIPGGTSYIDIVKRDVYTLIDYMQLKKFHKRMQILSRDNAEKAFNLFVAALPLFKKATEEIYNSQKKKMAEIEEQKKRILGKEIPELY